MKKIGWIILGFIIGALLTYKFCPRELEQAPLKTEITKPNGVISVEEAITLNDNWTKYRKAAVDSAAEQQGRKVDNRYTSWSIKDVRDYLNYADYEAGNMGYSLDSVRVYLGVYGENFPRNKSNLTTMFMAPIGKKNISNASILPSSASSFLQIPLVPPLNNGSGGPDPYTD